MIINFEWQCWSSQSPSMCMDPGVPSRDVFRRRSAIFGCRITPPHHPHLAVKEPIIVAHWFRDDDVSHLAPAWLISLSLRRSVGHELVDCYSYFHQIAWKWIIWNRITCILHVQLDKSRQMELLISIHSNCPSSQLTRCRLTWILASIQISWKLNIWTLVQCFRPVAWPDWRRWLAAPSGGSKRCPLNSIINPPSVRIPREQAAKLSDGGPQEGRWHHVKLIGEIKIHYTGSADWHLIGGGRSRDSVQPAENKHWTFERERGTEMSSVLSDGWCHRFDVATGQVNGTSADNKRNVRSNACHVMSHDTCQLIKWKKGQTWEVKFSLDPFFMRASFSGK